MRAVINWIRNSAILRIAAGFVLAALVLALSGWLVTGPYRSIFVNFDGSIRASIRQIQSPQWTAFFLAVTKLGSTIYLAIIGVVAGLIFIRLRWIRPLVLFIIAMAGQSLLHNGFEALIARPRPLGLINYPVTESFSFPSGHALSAACLYLGLSWLVTNRLENSAAKAVIWIFALTLVFLIGLSRVYIGIHYPTDVLAAYLATSIWTLAVMSADRKEL